MEETRGNLGIGNSAYFQGRGLHTLGKIVSIFRSLNGLPRVVIETSEGMFYMGDYSHVVRCDKEVPSCDHQGVKIFIPDLLQKDEEVYTGVWACSKCGHKTKGLHYRTGKKVSFASDQGLGMKD